MGKRGKKGGRGRGGFGRGGAGVTNAWTERKNKVDIDRHNEQFERYYDELGIVGKDEKSALWDSMRRDLPNSFRFTGSEGHALTVQQRLKDFYIPQITSISYEGEIVEAPKPVSWYPDQLAWYMTTPKHIVRRFPPFASFQKFLVAETDIGNISRQEVVSMIPPLCMDVKPGMVVLDLCAAPGSKTAQLIEMVHSGEEERSRTMTEYLAKGLDGPSGEEFDDEGRSTGLLVANDVDYKRAHMLVHQIKRLSSPNVIVMNHDATVFPSIKLPSVASTEGRLFPNKYLKFDRILADVPCSGDGTCRKNLEIWRNWNPGNALGLHATQVRILVRALQMLKSGGRVVYSTCSMNPIEDEAVLATAIDRCGGPDKVVIVDSSSYLPGLRRSPGLKSWKVMDKQGRVWNNYADVSRQREQVGDDGLGRLQESMFPPKDDLHLDKCMRIYPHLQDTGGFFIAILEKKSEIKVKVEERAKANQSASVEEDSVDVPDEVRSLDNNGPKADVTSLASETLLAVEQQQNGAPLKRKRAEEYIEQDPLKRSKLNDAEHGETNTIAHKEDSMGSSLAEADTGIADCFESALNGTISTSAVKPALPSTAGTESNGQPHSTFSFETYKVKKNGQFFEEPYKYLDPEIKDLEWIRKFYEISPRFPQDRFMVRNATGVATKNIYYTTALAKMILQENEGKGMKFVHCGVKMFVKQDVPNPDICPWRIQTDGLRILEPWIGSKRRMRLLKKETLRKLLIEMFPRFSGDEWKSLGEIGEQVKEIGMGCCVLKIEPSEDDDGLSERMIFPLWKSLHSLNLMLPKEDRKALLLRLFNDDTPLVNLSLGNLKGTNAKIESNVESAPQQNDIEQRNNSGSEDDEDGGVPIQDVQAKKPAPTVTEDVTEGSSLTQN